MRARCLLLLLALAGCGPALPPIVGAQLPPGMFGTTDPDLAAAQYAQYAFADSSRTYGDPAAGAKAVLAVDYLGGALNSAPRWAYLLPNVKVAAMQARLQTREAVGILPGAPSQLVVNSLAAARRDLLAGDTAAAQAALANPAFSVKPAEALSRLGNLPYMQETDTATTAAEEAMQTQQGESAPASQAGGFCEGVCASHPNFMPQ